MCSATNINTEANHCRPWRNEQARTIPVEQALVSGRDTTQRSARGHVSRDHTKIQTAAAHVQANQTDRLQLQDSLEHESTFSPIEQRTSGDLIYDSSLSGLSVSAGVAAPSYWSQHMGSHHVIDSHPNTLFTDTTASKRSDWPFVWTAWGLYQPMCSLDVELLLTMTSSNLLNDVGDLVRESEGTSAVDCASNANKHAVSALQNLPLAVPPQTSSDLHSSSIHCHGNALSEVRVSQAPQSPRSSTASAPLAAFSADAGDARMSIPLAHICDNQATDVNGRRRSWRRASNGQFASAAQLQQGDSDNMRQKHAGPHNTKLIRKRRKSEEIDRKYRCNFGDCPKAYGTLNRKYGKRVDESSAE